VEKGDQVVMRKILLPLAIFTWVGFGLWTILLEFQYLGLFLFIVSFIISPIAALLPLYLGITGKGWTLFLVAYGGGLIGTVFMGIAMSLNKDEGEDEPILGGASPRTCSNCWTEYSLTDYSVDAPLWLCSQCDATLPREQP
jgi:hypothetical protein